MRSLPRLALLLSVLLALSACEGRTPARLPTDPEAIPETSMTGVSIAEHWTLRDGFYVDALEAETGATRIGALLVLREAGPMPRVEVRGLDAQGIASEWTALDTTFEEPDQRVQRVDLSFVAMRAEIRIEAAEIDRVAVLTWSALVPPPSIATHEDDGALGVSQAPLRAEYAALGVRPRSAWGARATRCSDRDPRKTRIAIHHTVSAQGSDIASALRGIQAYHMDSNGWCDVGYHFLVALDGTIWEGRDLDLLGTHVGNNNTGNAGISFIGCFHPNSCGGSPSVRPTDTQIRNAGRVAGEIARLNDITITTNTLKGHRDHSGASTACPGDFLHARLGDIRSIAGMPATSRFGAQWVSQTFPLARDPFQLTPGQLVTGVIEMRNVGTEAWTPGATFLGTTQPRDGESPLAAPDWVSPRRPATVDRVVAPGEVGRFEFAVRGPDAVGDYPQFFSLVQEGVAWFSDPGMGGPSDDQLQVRVTTIPGPDAGPVAPDAGPITTADAGVVETPDASTPVDRDGGTSSGADAGTGGAIDGGCGCRVAAGGRSTRGSMLALSTLAILGLIVRRRR